MDRTKLFFSIAEAQCSALGLRPAAQPRPEKTPFGRAAAGLWLAMQAMEARVDRIGRLVSKSSLFDDPAAEIAEAISLVRQEMGSIGAHLEALAGSPRPGRQFHPHSEAVLAWLQGRLNSATAAFKAAVKQREAMLTAKEERTAKLSAISATASPFPRPAASPFPALAPSTPASGARLPKQSQLVRNRRTGQGPVPPECSALTREAYSSPPAKMEHTIDMSALGNGSPHSLCGSPDELTTPQALDRTQRQIWTPRPEKLRAQEVSKMQSTLSEVTKLFDQFGSIVAQQGEMIERIDANADVTLGNVDEAHTQILKYRSYISGNRGLIIKTFVVLWAIILVYGFVSR